MTDTAKSILWASQRFLPMTGYDPLDVMGKTPRFLQGSGTDQATVQHINTRLNNAQAVEVDLLNYRKNGESYLCHLQIKPLRNRQGKLTHFLAVENKTSTTEGDLWVR